MSGELPFAPAGLSRWAMLQESTSSIAKFFIARTVAARGPRFLPALSGGVSSAEDSDEP
jgi:hypothetical protein